MHTFYSTADIPAIRQLAFWQEAVCNTFIKVDCIGAAGQAFDGEIVTAHAADFRFSRVKSGAHRVARTPHHIRKGCEEILLFSIQLHGTGIVSQDGRDTLLETGDFACYDSTRPYTLGLQKDCEQLVLHMPLEPFLNRFGRTQDLTANAVRGSSQLGGLILPFVQGVSSLLGSVEKETAQGLSDLSLSLLSTALGEVLLTGAKGSRSQARTALLYRARAVIDANLHKASLNSEMIARSLGISRRYLQLLFQEDQTTVTDMIWLRRVEKARRDLLDPMLASQGIGQIAYGCGFQSLTHFSHRFKAAYRESPRAFRARQEFGSVRLNPI